MGVVRKIYSNRTDWLQGRKNGIGASEISAVLGCGFKTAIQLWKEKIGASEPDDLSNNSRVTFGNQAEHPMRDMFRLLHPEYELTFEPYLILRPEGKYNFLTCTPDGELVERKTGRKGLYESKTSTCLTKSDWEKWNCKIPDAYFCQICQGMYCGDFDFAVVWALLLNYEMDASLRFYFFERAECEWKIQEILTKGEIFWQRCVKKTLPPVSLVI